MVKDCFYDCWVWITILLLERFQTFGELTLHQEFSFVNNHSNTNEVHKGKPVMVGKHSVPDFDHVVYVELLCQQEHKPSQRVVLGIQSFISQMCVQFRIAVHHDEIKLSYFSINARVFMVHCPDKTVSYLAHNHIEAEEQVAFKVLKEVLLWHTYIVKAKVNGCQYLVHALHILNSRIKLGVNEQDFANDICMCFYVV